MTPLLVWRSPDGFYGLFGIDGKSWTLCNVSWEYVVRFTASYGYTIVSPNSFVAAIIRDNLRKKHGPICPE